VFEANRTPNEIDHAIKDHKVSLASSRLSLVTPNRVSHLSTRFLDSRRSGELRPVI